MSLLHINSLNFFSYRFFPPIYTFIFFKWQILSVFKMAWKLINLLTLVKSKEVEWSRDYVMKWSGREHALSMMLNGSVYSRLGQIVKLRPHNTDFFIAHSDQINTRTRVYDPCVNHDTMDSCLLLSLFTHSFPFFGSFIL